MPSLGVRLSVRLSVTLVDYDHIRRARRNFITRLISPMSSLAHAKFQRSSAKGTFSNLGLNRGGVGKIGDFQPISRRISETVRDRAKVTVRSRVYRALVVGLCTHVCVY